MRKIPRVKLSNTSIEIITLKINLSKDIHYINIR
jgi:hypothetical protein